MRFHKILISDDRWQALSDYYDEHHLEIREKHGFTNLYDFVMMLLDGGFEAYKADEG